MLTIDEETFFSFTKNMLIGYLNVSCHITNNDLGLYDITNINESVQGCSGSMSTMMKGKGHMKVHQVNGSEKSHVRWSVKCCIKADTNFFCLYATLAWN